MPVWVRTGSLALAALSLAVTAGVLSPIRKAPAVDPGDRTAVAVAVPRPEPAPAAPPAMPHSVPVYDAASVLAPPAPRIETQPVQVPRIELPQPPPPAPPKRRAEPRPEPPRPQVVRETPPPAPQPVAPSEPAIPPWASASVAPPPAPASSNFLVAPAATKPAPTGGLRSGRYPALAVDFQSIGLERYVRATEAAGGAFFAFLGTRGQGPQLSLLDGRPARKARDLDLAIERPYLVSDPAIEERLRSLDLPDGASTTSVVMVWPKWLDARAWRAIEQALRDEQIDGDQVAQIEARLSEGPDRAELQILGFKLLGDGGIRRLQQPKTIPVSAS
jgi:hypothetical protein